MPLIGFASGELLQDTNIKRVVPRFKLVYARSIAGHLVPGEAKPVITVNSGYSVEYNWVVEMVSGEDAYEVEKGSIPVSSSEEVFTQSELFKRMPEGKTGLREKVIAHMRALYEHQKHYVAAVTSGASGMIPVVTDVAHIEGIDDVTAPAPVENAPDATESIQAQFDVRLAELSALLTEAKKLSSKSLGKKDDESVTEFEGFYAFKEVLDEYGLEVDLPRRPDME